MTTWMRLLLECGVDDILQMLSTTVSKEPKFELYWDVDIPGIVQRAVIPTNPLIRALLAIFGFPMGLRS